MEIVSSYIVNTGIRKPEKSSKKKSCPKNTRIDVYKRQTYDRIERSLFKDRGESALQLSPKEMEIKNRMMLCVSKKMESPLIEDQELVTFLMHGCGGQAEPVSQSQAYRDIGMINRLVGNIQLAAKSWYRYRCV